MQAIQGYYDGTAIRLLEKIEARPNQRVIITIMDEFIEPARAIGKKGMRGALAPYTNPDLRAAEEGAWARAATEKNGHP